MTKTLYAFLAAIVCIAILTLVSVSETIEIGGRQIRTPDGFPDGGRELLKRFSQRVPASALTSAKARKSAFGGIVPTMMIRPNQELFVDKEQTGRRWYSFSGSECAGLGESFDGEDWGATFRKDGTAIEYHEVSRGECRTLEFYSNGRPAAYVSGSRSPEAARNVVSLCWTSDGAPLDSPVVMMPQDRKRETFEVFLAWRRSLSTRRGRLTYPDAESRTVAANLLAKGEHASVGIYKLVDPSRGRFEICLSLGEVFLSDLEKASKGWTDVGRGEIYYLGSLLAFCRADAATAVSTQLRTSDNEWLRLAGLAGLAGHGMLKEGTLAKDISLDALREYGRTGNALASGPLQALDAARRASMTAFTLGLCGDERVLEEILAQLRGDARRLGHAGVLCDVLGDARTKAAVPLLRELLPDESFGFPDCALRSLMRLGDKDAFPLAVSRLQAMKEHVDEKHLQSLCDLAAELEALTGETCYDDAGAWRTWWEANKATWSPPVCPEDMGRKDEKK